jgi:hypothetical protein
MPGIDLLKASLPNFPDEVLVDWLFPYAKTEGWPLAPDERFKPEKRWRYLLRNRPLTYWQSIRWAKVTRHISIQELRKDNQEIMVHMALGALKGQKNLYSESIPDLKERFARIVSYIGECGLMPKPPTLIREAGGLSVLDGNHRMSAYYYCYGYFTIDPGAELQLKTKEIQEFWVGEI